MAQSVTEVTADIKSHLAEIVKLVDELVEVDVMYPTLSTRKRIAGEIFVLLANIRGCLLILK